MAPPRPLPAGGGRPVPCHPLGDRPGPGALHPRIENVKFDEEMEVVSADGLVVMTWAFQAAGVAEQAQNPGSNPGRRILFWGESPYNVR